MCGGTIVLVNDLTPVTGLSPRVRGNHAHLHGADQQPGSIPACAGEPFVTADISGQYEVYPRVCGGTLDEGRILFDATGLSPRVRGNPDEQVVDSNVEGSIPACGGGT